MFTLDPNATGGADGAKGVEAVEGVDGAEGIEGPAVTVGFDGADPAPVNTSTSKSLSGTSLPPQPMRHVPAQTLPGCTPSGALARQICKSRPWPCPPITALGGMAGPATHDRVPAPATGVVGWGELMVVAGGLVDGVVAGVAVWGAVMVVAGGLAVGLAPPVLHLGSPYGRGWTGADMAARSVLPADASSLLKHRFMV